VGGEHARRVSADAVRSVLVCRLSALGDVVLSQAVAAALAERFPDAERVFLSREPYGRILRDDADSGRLVLWGGPGHALPAAVRERSWDLVCDLSASGRSRQLLAGVRARRTLRPRKQTWQRFAFVRLRAFGGGAVSLSSALDRLFTCVAPLGIGRGDRVPRLTSRAADASSVLLAPGAGRETKRWATERFRAVALRVIEAGRTVVAVGTEDERALVESVATGADPSRLTKVVGGDLADLPQVVRRCRVALTNDSGLLHVAEACGVPVVALFGPTHPRIGFAPLRPDSIALHTGIGCSPCDIHGPDRCPRGHHRCMTELSVERVTEEVLARCREGVAA
jgi:heptosyltransferase-2